MILRSGILAAAFALAGCIALPAQAGVLEISADGQARWIAGPIAGAVAEEAAILDPVPLGEVPIGVLALLPEDAVANTRQHAAGIPANYAAIVQDLAHRFDLSPALIEAVVWQESRWRTNAVSPAGARGLAQLMPGTARDLGVDPDDPIANLEGGARYLREQLDRFDGDLERALAAYNAGPGRVIRSGGVPPIRETQTYVAAIMGRLADHSRSPE
ncbi:transglycosylase SLT domain protein [Aurantiacibacter atlanticus]|uniref:Transglycosylase SLT domain protein n=1 Tax=Aurantiacibacter atlanticus TaxID=1648404 RepID=A0A0H4VES7_9SPHN|nr:lytic transglycosylase domain-containing protein [Aurantiacibacter atlanticus]AKQ42850.1 transglycosylase SLT domain protein [Aurantiacibacter atlanticus]MDF1834877.1 lytic transglycosylase domain-containing protein [Alteraurantiacibacter sp. bin_em_oilr2.035]